MKESLIALALILVAGPAAAGGDSAWTLRFHGALVESPGQHGGSWTSGTSGRVEVDGGGGVGLAAEYRLWERVGLEVSVLLTGLTIDTRFSAGGSQSLEALELSMAPLTLGVPIHLGPGGRADIYLGPTLSYVRYVEVSSSVSFRTARSSVDLDSDIAPGAALGLDAAFGDRGWAFSTGLRYMKTSAGGTNIDPLIVTLGFAHRF